MVLLRGQEKLTPEKKRLISLVPRPSSLVPRPSPLVPLPLSMRLTLYQRDDCHLCDLALEVLAQARLPDFDSVFIDDDAELEARYGERVPVLRDDEGGYELNWPFDAEGVITWAAR